MQARGGKAIDIDAGMLLENRNEDRELYAIHVLANWRGIGDRLGQPVECTGELRKEFCLKLPDWIFDRIRDHAARPERFAEDLETPPNIPELAGNL